METSENLKLEIRDNSQRAKNAVYALAGICVLDIVSIIVSYFQYSLLLKIQQEGSVSEEEMFKQGIMNIIIGFVGLVLVIITTILFLNWFRRAYSNLYKVGMGYRLEYSEKWSVWAWFVPIVSLYQPYQITIEIFRSIQEKIKELMSDYKMDNNTFIIGLWWAFYIISNLVANISVYLSFWDNIPNLIFSNQLGIFSQLFNIIAAVLAILVISNIYQKEELLKTLIDVNSENNIGKEE